MNTAFAMSNIGVRTISTSGMQLRSSLRAFGKEHGTLSKKDEETLDALDRFETYQAKQREQAKQNQNRASLFLKRSTTVGGLSTVSGGVTDSRRANSLARSYESQAMGFSSQARAAAAADDQETARSLEAKALSAYNEANKMHAKAAELARREAEERKAKLDREAKDQVEKRKALEAAREALEAVKREKIEVAREKESAAKHHLEASKQAERKRHQADHEMWSKRVAEGQFWIHQMSLAQKGSHPAQAVTQMQIQAFQESSLAPTAVAADYVPAVAATPAPTAILTAPVAPPVSLAMPLVA